MPIRRDARGRFTSSDTTFTFHFDRPNSGTDTISWDGSSWTAAEPPTRNTRESERSMPTFADAIMYYDDPTDRPGPFVLPPAGMARTIVRQWTPHNDTYHCFAPGTTVEICRYNGSSPMMEDFGDQRAWCIEVRSGTTVQWVPLWDLGIDPTTGFRNDSPPRVATGARSRPAERITVDPLAHLSPATARALAEELIRADDTRLREIGAAYLANERTSLGLSDLMPGGGPTVGEIMERLLASLLDDPTTNDPIVRDLNEAGRRYGYSAVGFVQALTRIPAIRRDLTVPCRDCGRDTGTTVRCGRH